METVDFDSLSKKERRELRRQMEKGEGKRNEAMKKVRNWVIGLLVIGLLGLGTWFIYKELSKPLPGQKLEDLGRGHIPREEWEKFTYNSNPPTSGSHDEQWVKAGVFSTPQLEGQLVHSLEHGYVVISYNCGKVGGAEGREIIIDALNDDDCGKLKKKLSDLANDKKLWKLIVVPRSQLDTRIAVTAWTWIEKMDSFDKDRIVAFIDAHRNHGPEQTME